jgi:hypothetical protein
MEAVLKRADSKNKKKIKITTDLLHELLFPKIVFMLGCAFIDYNYEPVKNKEKALKQILKNFSSKTEFEYDRNEIVINHYIYDSDSNLFASDVLPLALTVIDVWSIELKIKEPDSNFCFYLSCSDKDVTLRFHKLRKNEKMWYEDLEGFIQPVAYKIT